MSGYSPELQEFLKTLEEKKKMTAMLAPSFPVDFPYPGIVGKLKRLGFAHVVEVARGAADVNKELLRLLNKNPHSRFITSPCPSIVRLIKNRYQKLAQSLAPIPSPMAMTAKLVIKQFPDCRPVFIGPCLAKKTEVREDYPGLGIIVLTFQELNRVFLLKNIKNDDRDFLEPFDIIGSQTRLYSISGGLAQSSGLNDLMTDDEYDVVSGLKMIEKGIAEFQQGKLRVLDILYCEGGCIAGPGIVSRESIDKRRQKVLAHWAAALRG